MSYNNNGLFITQDYDLNKACNSLIASCLELLHKGKLAVFNEILEETVKQNNMVLKQKRTSAKKPRKAKKVKKTTRGKSK